MQKGHKRIKGHFRAIFSKYITDQANVKAVTSAPPNPIVYNAKWDQRSDRFDL